MSTEKDKTNLLEKLNANREDTIRKMQERAADPSVNMDPKLREAIMRFRKTNTVRAASKPHSFAAERTQVKNKKIEVTATFTFEVPETFSTQEYVTARFLKYQPMVMVWRDADDGGEVSPIDCKLEPGYKEIP